jgi:transposase-like protein
VKERLRLPFRQSGRPAVPLQVIQKHQTRLDGFADKILALYARGMTTRDIQAQVQELYGVQVSPSFISNITEAVMDEVRECAKPPARCGLAHRVCGLTGA